MYPSGVNFLRDGVGLPTMTPEGYDSVMDRIVPAAQGLAMQGARAVILFGTSLSFYNGPRLNQHLADFHPQSHRSAFLRAASIVLRGSPDIHFAFFARTRRLSPQDHGQFRFREFVRALHALPALNHWAITIQHWRVRVQIDSG